jgi:hypothetical protein
LEKRPEPPKTTRKNLLAVILSEGFLRIQNKKPREILRAKSALRMTPFRLFPQTVQTLPTRWITRTPQVLQTPAWVRRTVN